MGAGTCDPVQSARPGADPARLARRAGRYQQSFPPDHADQSGRLGCLERNRGCRPRPAPCPAWLSGRRDPVSDAGSAAGKGQRLAGPAFTLAEGLYADLVRADARRQRISGTQALCFPVHADDAWCGDPLCGGSWPVGGMVSGLPLLPGSFPGHVRLCSALPLTVHQCPVGLSRPPVRGTGGASPTF